MKKNLYITFLMLTFSGIQAYSEDSIPVTISSTIFYGEDDEWLQLKITNTLSDQIWYDSLATVFVANGFQDTIYLNAGTYICEIIDMGANVSMPIITLNNGYVVPWGYPAYEYYHFTVPGGDLNSYSSISDTACYSYNSPSLKYNWTESGTYLDTIPNSIGYDSIIWINLTIVSIDNTVIQSDGVLTAVESDAEYQWLVCNTSNDIFGADSSCYTPIVSGLYSVEITKNGCVSTSSCYGVVISELNKINLERSVSFYPNPVNENLNIDLGNEYKTINIVVKDLSGRNISYEQFNNQDKVQLNLEKINGGMYLIQVNADKEEAMFKVLKK